MSEDRIKQGQIVWGLFSKNLKDIPMNNNNRSLMIFKNQGDALKHKTESLEVKCFRIYKGRSNKES